ncbi:hypothetical protein E2C01_061696 [Portunus trituberculatus]|uniref:Uncharacterized protein n=1 Tax=Portunus trituberculatus TaxID=210409 RepID=A0A5B7HCK0_PORTR|nr:hypothetical protein [Portunus trituberculatus]
MTSPTAPTLT